MNKFKLSKEYFNKCYVTAQRKDDWDEILDMLLNINLISEKDRIEYNVALLLPNNLNKEMILDLESGYLAHKKHGYSNYNYLDKEYFKRIINDHFNIINKTKSANINNINTMSKKSKNISESDKNKKDYTNARHTLIKVFRTGYNSDTEAMANEFLSNNDVEIIDMKFNSHADICLLYKNKL